MEGGEPDEKRKTRGSAEGFERNGQKDKTHIEQSEERKQQCDRHKFECRAKSLEMLFRNRPFVILSGHFSRPINGSEKWLH